MYIVQCLNYLAQLVFSGYLKTQANSDQLDLEAEERGTNYTSVLLHYHLHIIKYLFKMLQKDIS